MRANGKRKAYNQLSIAHLMLLHRAFQDYSGMIGFDVLRDKSPSKPTIIVEDAF
jgi:hypothetical protein